MAIDTCHEPNLNYGHGLPKKRSKVMVKLTQRKKSVEKLAPNMLLMSTYGFVLFVLYTYTQHVKTS